MSKGSPDRTTLAVETLLEREAERLTSKVVEKALEGDLVALRLCVERLLPPRRDRPVAFDLPKIKNAADALNASSAILAACAGGPLSPGEAAEIMSLVSTHVRMCQSASDRDPRSASKRDPFVLRFERLALALSELVGVAETGRARVVA